MKQVILEKPSSEVAYLQDVNQFTPIFAMRDGGLIGMLVKEESKWIIRTGGSNEATGRHSTRKDCLQSGVAYGYTYYIEEFSR